MSRRNNRLDLASLHEHRIYNQPFLLEAHIPHLEKYSVGHDILTLLLLMRL